MNVAPSDFEDEESPEDRICSTLRWCDVSLPQSVTAADLDALIFAELAPRLRKVARIVYRVFETLEAQSNYVSPKVIAARVRELAERFLKVARIISRVFETLKFAGPISVSRS